MWIISGYWAARSSVICTTILPCESCLPSGCYAMSSTQMAGRSFITVRKTTNAPSTQPAGSSIASLLNSSPDPGSPTDFPDEPFSNIMRDSSSTSWERQYCHSRATVKDQKQPVRAGGILQRPDGAGLAGQCELRKSLARIWGGCIAIVCSPDVTRTHLGWDCQPGGSQPSKFSHGCGLFGEILGRMIHSTIVASCDAVVLVTSTARVS